MEINYISTFVQYCFYWKLSMAVISHCKIEFGLATCSSIGWIKSKMGILIIDVENIQQRWNKDISDNFCDKRETKPTI